VSLTPWAGQTIRIVFVATDGGAGSLVEAAVDDVRVTRP
jgi:aminopeptidase S